MLLTQKACKSTPWHFLWQCCALVFQAGRCSIYTYGLVLFQSSDAVNPDRMYDLAAVVVHCGTGINRGHYIAIVKSHRFWLLFDDDAVDVSNTSFASAVMVIYKT